MNEEPEEMPVAEEPVPKQRKKKTNPVEKKVKIYLRTCHDCGKPTSDYRCADCLSKWRQKNHIVEDAVWAYNTDTYTKY